MGELAFGLIVALYLLGIVVLICWIVLPFALIGTKPILRQILEQQRETNAHLAALVKVHAPGSPTIATRAAQVPARQITTR